MDGVLGAVVGAEALAVVEGFAWIGEAGVCANVEQERSRQRVKETVFRMAGR